MRLYKIIDEFSRETGKKIGSRKVFDFNICDFTGEKIDEHSNLDTYNVNYQSNDPCFGYYEAEEWLRDWNEDIDAYDLFGQGNYIFKTNEHGIEVFGEMIEIAQRELKKYYFDKQIKEIYSLDHLLRWSRGRMLEKVLKEGKYKIEQFLEE